MDFRIPIKAYACGNRENILASTSASGLTIDGSKTTSVATIMSGAYDSSWPGAGDSQSRTSVAKSRQWSSSVRVEAVYKGLATRCAKPTAHLAREQLAQFHKQLHYMIALTYRVRAMAC